MQPVLYPLEHVPEPLGHGVEGLGIETVEQATMKVALVLSGLGFAFGLWVIWNELSWLGRSEVARVILVLGVGLCLVSAAVVAVVWRMEK